MANTIAPKPTCDGGGGVASAEAEAGAAALGSCAETGAAGTFELALPRAGGGDER